MFGDDGALPFVLCGADDETEARLSECLGRLPRPFLDRSDSALEPEDIAAVELMVLRVDARGGLLPDSCRQAAIAHLFGIRHMVLAVDGMADAGFDQARFETIAAAFRTYAGHLGIPHVHCLPISSRDGDNIAAASVRMPWYEGPCLRRHLERQDAAGAAGGAVERPAQVTDQFAAHLLWLSADPLLPSRRYVLRLGGRTVGAEVTDLKYRLNVESLERQAGKTLERDGIGFCNFALDQAVAFDPCAEHRPTGTFLLADRVTGAIVAAGAIAFGLRRATNLSWQALDIDKAARARLNGQRPCVVWLTGLSGSGKSTVANLLERKLHAAGRHTYVLDGDNVRHGLNKDLGFTDADRVENIRRIAEVARLFVDAGLIVITAFISPFRSERCMARELLGDGEFHEIFVDAPLAECERRDPKGLYRKARAGQIKHFTGIDSAYEPPEEPALALSTAEMDAETAADRIIALLQRKGHV